MILLVDAGNSRVKWRLQSQGRVHLAGVVPTSESTALEFSGRGLTARAAVVSCVAGTAARLAVEEGLLGALNGSLAQCHWLTSCASCHGLISHYRPPESLGTDRFAAMVAAHRRQAVDWVVATVGTALTVDMLTAHGHFLGGAIAPGPELMQQALMHGTAGVSADSIVPFPPTPDTTLSAVSQGIGWGLWGVVEGMAHQFQESTGVRPKILLSGGGRSYLRPFLGAGTVEVDELVLEGLAWIARDLGYDA